jgi:hypothetical protein
MGPERHAVAESVRKTCLLHTIIIYIVYSNPLSNICPDRLGTDIHRKAEKENTLLQRL